jgi:hypothetical protein
MKNLFAGLSALLTVLLLSACSNPGPRNKGVVLLLDTSGTYTEEMGRAQALINALLVEMEPGDSFAVDRINTASFTEKDIIAKVTFSDRPSEANQQKRQFRDTVDKFVKTVKPSQFTDITGGILQAIEYLNEKHTGKKTILVYSDLKEELPKGFVRDIPLQMQDFNVVALNVTKLHSDNVDPREYMARLDQWKKRVEAGGGHWKVINDMDRLDHILQR